MSGKNVTLKVDEKLYTAYRQHCREKGLVMSRQFEIFIEQELKKTKGLVKNV